MKIYALIFILFLSTAILLTMFLTKDSPEDRDTHIGQRPVSVIEANVYKRSVESISYVDMGLTDLSAEIVKLDGIGEVDRERIVSIINDCKNLNQNTLGWVNQYHDLMFPTPVGSKNSDDEE